MSALPVLDHLAVSRPCVKDRAGHRGGDAQRSAAGEFGQPAAPAGSRGSVTFTRRLDVRRPYPWGGLSTPARRSARRSRTACHANKEAGPNAIAHDTRSSGSTGKARSRSGAPRAQVGQDLAQHDARRHAPAGQPRDGDRAGAEPVEPRDRAALHVELAAPQMLPAQAGWDLGVLEAQAGGQHFSGVGEVAPSPPPREHRGHDAACGVALVDEDVAPPVVDGRVGGEHDVVQFGRAGARWRRRRPT